MKRNLLKLALCAMAALPLGAWADAISDITLWTFDSYTAGSQTVAYNFNNLILHSKLSNEKYDDFSLNNGRKNGGNGSKTYTFSDVQKTSATLTSILCVKRGFDVTTLGNVNSTKDADAYGGSIAFQTSTPGKLYVYCSTQKYEQDFQIAMRRTDLSETSYTKIASISLQAVDQTVTGWCYNLQEIEADVQGPGHIYMAGKTAGYVVYAILFVPTVPVTITSAKYATFCSDKALDFSETGIKAYTATDGETKVTLSEITSGQVPANTPVVLYKADADGTSVNVPVIASADAVSENDLAVVTEEGGKTGVANMFVLSKPAGKKVGFYVWAVGSTLNKGKVYLQGKASYESRSFLGFDDETTGIEELKNSKTEELKSYYNLNGQRVATPTKGLYIVNGKKIIINK